MSWVQYLEMYAWMYAYAKHIIFFFVPNIIQNRFVKTEIK